jgi:hypothetical protein
VLLEFKGWKRDEWVWPCKKTGIYLPIHLWDLNMEEKERDQIIFIEINNNLLFINRETFI